MRIDRFDEVTIITADDGNYLLLKNLPEEIDTVTVGKPVRIIFDNSGEIPEFEEKTLK